jgi:hypothetical protein
VTIEELIDLARTTFTTLGWPVVELGADALEVTHDWSGIPFKSRLLGTGEGPVAIYDSRVPEAAPVDRRYAIARFLTRVNLGLAVGAFEMDWDDGSIRCRTSIDLHGAAMTSELLGGLTSSNHQAMIDFAGYLLAVLRGDQEADEAYEEARTTLG